MTHLHEENKEDLTLKKENDIQSEYQKGYQECLRQVLEIIVHWDMEFKPRAIREIQNLKNPK
jgi:hypothetical protein